MAFMLSYVAAGVAVTVATCLVGMYLYLVNAFSYWKRRGVHYIPPTSMFGNVGGMILQKEHLGQCLKKAYDKTRDQPVIGMFALTKPFLLVRDLDVVRSVMVKDAHAFLDRSTDTSQDEKSLVSRSLFFLKSKQWRHMRIKLTPTFTSGKLKNMFYLINECGRQLLPCIDEEISKGKNVMVKDTMARYSTDVIASCAFGVNANALADPNCEFRATTRQIFELKKSRLFIATLRLLVPWLIKVLKLKVIDESVDNFLRKTFWNVVDYRKKNKIVRKDFVDILMQMKDKGQVSAEDVNDLNEIKEDSKYLDVGHTNSDNLNIELEDDDFVAQAFVFVAAGFETSSSVISFTLYELALNPGIQEKLRQEIFAVLDKHNSQVTYDAIAGMSYLDMVVSETLRKYPTLPVLERKCLQDYIVPDTDIIIEKGTSVMIPVLAIHLDPDIYPEPEKFDPERFNPEHKGKRSNFAHIPFGEGPRICIGMRFGQMQVKTALVHILTTYKVKPCAETPQSPLGMNPIVGVNSPIKDIVLAFEKI